MELIFLVIGWVLVVTICAIVAFDRTRRQRAEIEDMKRAIAVLRSQSADQVIEQKNPIAVAPPTLAPVEVPSIAETATPEPAAPPEPPPALKPGKESQNMEERLTTRWLVWLGALAIALAGIFLAKFTIEHGLLGPWVRFLFGLIIAVALVLVGEWLRRQPLSRSIAAIRSDYVPPALTSAGLITAFASLYAAHAIYDLIPATVDFVLLGAVSLAAFGLSLLQGVLIAALGIVGGYLVPALVSSKAPSAWGLFPYLLLITTAGLGVVRYKDWRWLSFLLLAGSVIWPLLWLIDQGRGAGSDALAFYLPATLVAFYCLLPKASPDLPADFLSVFRLRPLSGPCRMIISAAVGIALVIFILTEHDDQGLLSLLALGLTVTALVEMARRDSNFDILAIGAAFLTTASLAAWDFPSHPQLRAPRVLGDTPIGLEFGPLLPPELEPFAWACGLFAAAFAIVAFLLLWRARRPAVWASLSAGMPLVLLAVAYWRIQRFEVDLGWTAVALALAAAEIFVASRIKPFTTNQQITEALAAYAVGAVGALSLALTMALQEAWLTVGLSLLVPAIALIHRSLRLATLRWVAAIVGAVVISRLALNPHIFTYAIGRGLGFDWLLYGYGIPAAAFAWAAREFRKEADDHLVAILDAGTLIFGVLFVTLEIRHLVGDGPLDRSSYGLFEQSLHSLAWLAVAYGLFRRRDQLSSRVATWGWRILAGAAAAQVFLLQVVVFNPMKTGISVWEPPVINLLFLAYGLPAIFALLFMREARRQGQRHLAIAAGIAAFILSFLDLSLEVRHLYHGEFLFPGRATNGEWYSYSAAWLVFAGLLLAVGVLRRNVGCRYASLIVVLLTVTKVFLWDLSALEDLYRVASFFMLGGCLIGIGYVYQRFFLMARQTPPS